MNIMDGAIPVSCGIIAESCFIMLESCACSSRPGYATMQVATIASRSSDEFLGERYIMDSSRRVGNEGNSDPYQRQESAPGLPHPFSCVARGSNRGTALVSRTP